MLRTSPFHKENYSRLILAVPVEFYQRFFTRFQSSTGEQKPTDTDLKVALAGDWAQRPNLHPWPFEIFKTSEVNTPKEDQPYRREAHLELNFVGKGDVVENKVIGSTRNLATLGSLYTNLASGHRISSCVAV